MAAHKTFWNQPGNLLVSLLLPLLPLLISPCAHCSRRHATLPFALSLLLLLLLLPLPPLKCWQSSFTMQYIGCVLVGALLLLLLLLLLLPLLWLTLPFLVSRVSAMPCVAASPAVAVAAAAAAAVAAVAAALLVTDAFLCCCCDAVLPS